MATHPRTPAESLPVARVLPLLGLIHLDRYFDYRLSEADSESAQPGVKVRVRFGGRLVDAILISRHDTSEHQGSLRYIERVISPEVVYPPSTQALVEKLAERYAGCRSDMIRAAVPNRHAAAEKTDFTTSWDTLGDAAEPDMSAWDNYVRGQAFLKAVKEGKPARIAWQINPDGDWAAELAAALVHTVRAGHGALAVVPHQRALDRLEAALRELVSAKQITTLSATLGPQARYRRFLSILHGQSRLVIGTRSAAFAPVQDLRLAAIMFDGDDNLVDPRAPYWHAREVLSTRSAQEKCALIMGGYARTAEVQLMVERGWAFDCAGERGHIRQAAPLTMATGASAYGGGDPLAKSRRIPSKAYQAVRAAVEAQRPVLVQVPRKGYAPTLACRRCRAAARCRHCNGPLELPASGDPHVPVSPQCRWCGRIDAHHECLECGSTEIRAVVIGSDRTAEELGRAFSGVRVVTSSGEKIVSEIDPGPTIVVATSGAEPRVVGGRYGAAILLDTWGLLSKQDLRAGEEALASWLRVGSLVDSRDNDGQLIVVADQDVPVVQALLRWDPIGAAHRELAERAEVELPPTTTMAVVDGGRASLDRFVELLELPEHVEVLGPVDLPPGVHLPGEWDERAFGPPERMIIRGSLPAQQLGRILKAGQIKREVRSEDPPLRVQVGPLRIG
ncbi:MULTISPECIES: primosomal protein N' [Corynebacterium]|uniref:primosomal protein N' n=1 Tax=Corynebacterium TaxID=1716 RepID=UPI00124D1101|nr:MULTISPECIES: primosomal protein N' [Corynebacterium]